MKRLRHHPTIRRHLAALAPSRAAFLLRRSK